MTAAIVAGQRVIAIAAGQGGLPAAADHPVVATVAKQILRRRIIEIDLDHGIAKAAMQGGLT